MKKFWVWLTYMSIKTPQKVSVMATDSTHARQIAGDKYPLAKIEGPSAVLEAK